MLWRTCLEILLTRIALMTLILAMSNLCFGNGIIYPAKPLWPPQFITSSIEMIIGMVGMKFGDFLSCLVSKCTFGNLLMENSQPMPTYTDWNLKQQIIYSRIVQKLCNAGMICLLNLVLIHIWLLLLAQDLDFWRSKTLDLKPLLRLSSSLSRSSVATLFLEMNRLIPMWLFLELGLYVMISTNNLTRSALCKLKLHFYFYRCFLVY